MAARVSLTKIVDELESVFEGWLSFVNVETGEVLSLSTAVLSAAEEGPEEDEEEYEDDEEYQTAVRVVTSDAYVRLPSKWDIHEWEIMRDFAEEVGPPRLRAELLDAVHGSGAFRHFKNTLRHRGIEKQWWDYRRRALREVVIEWCEEHGLAFVE